VKRALQGGIAWWIAPTYTLAAEGWRVIKHLVAQIPGTQIRETDKLVTFPSLTPGWVQIRSSDQQGALRGVGLDFAVLEEFAYGREESWTEEIRPALTDRKGDAMFISTPDGFNHFWRLFQRGQDPLEPEWASWQKPTRTNPFIDPAEIEKAKEDLDEATFAKEYDAAFLAAGDALFRNVAELSTQPLLARGLPGRDYAIGIDWGKVRDFTVLSVWDIKARKQVYVDRFNRIDYRIQSTRVIELARRFRPLLILAEENSIGMPIIESLQARGLPIQGWTATAPAKKAMIELYQLGFERKALRLCSLPEQRAEHQAFRAEKLPSGLIRYTAPHGMHDDTVIAGALGFFCCGLPRTTPQRLTFGARLS
jgi:hypothetical protein